MDDLGEEFTANNLLFTQSRKNDILNESGVSEQLSWPMRSEAAKFYQYKPLNPMSEVMVRVRKKFKRMSYTLD